MSPILLLLLPLLLLVSAQETTPPPAGSDSVSFSRRLYSILGTKGAEEIANDNREEFDRLNVGGTLGYTLTALFEMRLEDLLISVRHARKMKEVIDLLNNPK